MPGEGCLEIGATGVDAIRDGIVGVMGCGRPVTEGWMASSPAAECCDKADGGR